MSKKLLTYGAVLIGGYLVVVHFQGASSVTSSGGNAFANIVKAFQGR